MRDDVLNDAVSEYIPPKSLEEQWDLPASRGSCCAEFGLDLPVQQWGRGGQASTRKSARAHHRAVAEA